MIFLKLLLSSGLTFLAATAFLTSSQKNEQAKQNKLNDTCNIAVHHYAITITPRMEQNIFYGESNVSIQLSARTSEIKLYSVVECISEVWLSDSPPRYRHIAYNEEMIVYKPIIPVYNFGMESIDLVFVNELLPGNYSLNMKFHSFIANDTNLLSFYKPEDQLWSVPTHFHMLGAQRLFPCLGDFITTYDITIQHHRNYSVLSNMPVFMQSANDEDMKITYFQTTSVLPTYLIAAIVTNFNRKVSKDRIYMWYRKSSESRITFAMEIIDRVTMFLQKKFIYIRQFHKVDHFAIPHFQDEGIVSLGLILYREADIIYDEMLDSVVRKNEVARIIGYKLVKEYVLNYVYWSSPFWFVDGLLRFYGTDAINAAISESRIMDLFVVQYQHEFLDMDTSSDTTQFNRSFEIPHVKVIIMLRMFQYALTKKIFIKCVHSLMQNKESISEHKLSQIMVQYLDESTISSLETIKQDLIDLMDKMSIWINQRTYPTMKVMQEYISNRIRIKLTLENYNTSVDHVYAVPVTYTTQKNLSFDNTVPISLIKFDSAIFYLKDNEGGWVIFNLQQIGYYRVNYEDTNWIKISDYLNLPDQSFKKIHVLNRAQIIDDAFHFMIINKLNSFIFWNITQYLKDETDYVAWYPMFKALEYISSVFPFHFNKSSFIRQKVQSILYALLENIKYEEVPDEDDFIKLLRQEAAKWACVLDVPKCKEIANRKLEQHLTDPERHKILPWWKEWTYRNGLLLTSGPLMAQNSTWWATYELGLKTSDIKFVEYLAYHKTPHIIFESIKSMDNIWEKYGVNQVYYFLVAVTRHGREIDMLIKDIIQELHKIKHISSVNINAALTVLINSLYSKDHLDEVREFLKDEMKNVQITAMDGHKRNIIYTNETEKIEIHLEIMKYLKEKEHYIQLITTKVDRRFSELNQQMSLFKNIQPIIK